MHRPQRTHLLVVAVLYILWTHARCRLRCCIRVCFVLVAHPPSSVCVICNARVCVCVCAFVKCVKKCNALCVYVCACVRENAAYRYRGDFVCICSCVCMCTGIGSQTIITPQLLGAVFVGRTIESRSIIRNSNKKRKRTRRRKRLRRLHSP